MHSKLVILCNFSSEFSLLFFWHSILLLSLKSINMKNNIFKMLRNNKKYNLLIYNIYLYDEKKCKKYKKYKEIY